jgi:hypothetical protein
MRGKTWQTQFQWVLGRSRSPKCSKRASQQISVNIPLSTPWSIIINDYPVFTMSLTHLVPLEPNYSPISPIIVGYIHMEVHHINHYHPVTIVNHCSPLLAIVQQPLLTITNHYINPSQSHPTKATSFPLQSTKILRTWGPRQNLKLLTCCLHLEKGQLAREGSLKKGYTKCDLTIKNGDFIWFTQQTWW